MGTGVRACQHAAAVRGVSIVERAPTYVPAVNVATCILTIERPIDLARDTYVPICGCGTLAYVLKLAIEPVIMTLVLCSCEPKARAKAQVGRVMCSG